MTTCKATFLILLRQKVYLAVYLGFLVVMVLALSAGVLSSVETSRVTTYEPERPVVAIVDRDGDRASLSTSMREFLESTCDFDTLEDNRQAMEEAVASNYVDLIVIVPDGFADDMVAYLDGVAAGDMTESIDGNADGSASGSASGRAGGTSATGDAPQLETVTSYTSARGSLAELEVNDFLSLTRLEAVGAAAGTGNVATDGTADTAATGAKDGTSPSDSATSSVTLTTLADAAAGAVDASRADGTSPSIGVAYADDEDAGATGGTSETKAEASRQLSAESFAYPVKVASYPVFMVMAIVTAVVLKSFRQRDLRARLTIAPRREWLDNLGQWTVLVGFAMAVSVFVFGIVVVFCAVAGVPLGFLTAAPVAACWLAIFVYALASMTFGFLLSMINMNDSALNGVVNVVGLLLMFTSGTAFDASLMPDIMIAIGKCLPAWWYCRAIDAVMGIGSYAGSGDAGSGVANMGEWMASTGLVVLYAVAFLSCALAVDALHTRATTVGPSHFSQGQLESGKNRA
ncbi:ABC transporter permease [Bifidobacterium choloepi]|uniref:ABC-2 type transporter transmembrane domain-containing protein n=1 Tax=Bifidobacterium choloepi TaxID=2614131 RepID=A0A6I5NIB8_9BIFI|nr:ABC transporter permease [Bifidobacterium choloepi]NEG70113.1 hypothetical protein [Bifidobacterium choloepi]